MDDNKAKEWDAFFAKAIKEVGLEEPCATFTASVISKIKTDNKTSLISNEPLIAKPIWFLGAVTVLAMTVWAIFGFDTSEPGWLTSIKPDGYLGLGHFNILSFDLSNTAIYALIGFTFFVLLQVYLLKHRYEKKILLS